MLNPRRLPLLLALALAFQVLAPPGATVAQSGTPVAPAAAGFAGVVAIATGGSHALALRVDGSVWGWGTNSDWELGVTTAAAEFGSTTPVRATGLSGVKAIATGDDHGLALRDDGHVWAWGKNDHGQVGVPKGTNCPYHPRPCVQTPVLVPGLSRIKAIAANQDSSYAVDADGTVWAWGDNRGGRLGTGDAVERLAPTRVAGATNVVSLSVRSPHVVALGADGRVWTWGGTTTSPVETTGLNGVVAVAAGVLRNLALKADGTVWAWSPDKTDAPAAVAGLGPVAAIAGDNYLSGAIGADGRVWVWLVFSTGGTSKPKPVAELTDVVALAIGGEINVALKADGTVWTWDQYGPHDPVPAPGAAT